MGAFRYVLFAAVAFSLSVYGYRAYRRWIAPTSPDAPPGADRGSSPSSTRSVLPPSIAAPAAPPLPAASKPKAKRGMGFTDPTELPSERDAAGSESLVQQVIREELARKQGIDPTAPAGSDPAAGASGRSGLFAGGSADPGGDRVSVAAALTGVRLPDGLVPLVGDVADPHHVTFITSSQPAAAVGRHLGDELERLGFQMRSESDVVAVATKGAVTLRVTLHPEASTERLDGAARFPTAGPTSVVVEFQT